MDIDMNIDTHTHIHERTHIQVLHLSAATTAQAEEQFLYIYFYIHIYIYIDTHTHIHTRTHIQVFHLSAATTAQAEEQFRLLQKKAGACLVVDGRALALCTDNFAREFVAVALRCPAVVCCRCSPTQKALMVRLLTFFVCICICMYLYVDIHMYISGGRVLPLLPDAEGAHGAPADAFCVYVFVCICT